MAAIGSLRLTLPVVSPAVMALNGGEYVSETDSAFGMSGPMCAIWFGILVVKMAEFCLITPPIGLNCFVVAGYLFVFSGIIALISLIYMHYFTNISVLKPNNIYGIVLLAIMNFASYTLLLNAVNYAENPSYVRAFVALPFHYLIDPFKIVVLRRYIPAVNIINHWCINPDFTPF